MRAKTPPSKVNRQILDEASEWFVDFRVGDVDSSARERFDEWLRRSPEHIRAYMEIARTYVELPARPAGKVDIGELIAYARSGENVVPLHHTSTARPSEPASMAAKPKPADFEAKRARRNPRMRRRFLAVASGALSLVIGGTVWWQIPRFPSYATDVGERRSITLADGSTVDLNARSRVRIEFSDAERRVELLEGQALFQVAKDKRRAFIVRSGSAFVRAVGTQFDVYRKASGTTVTVLEGRVAVYSTAQVEATTPARAPSPTAGSPHSTESQTPRHSASASLSSGNPVSGSLPVLPAEPPGLAPDLSGSAAVFVGAGEQVTVTAQKVVAAPEHADIAAATAWMQRRLIFDGSRLSDVVEEFNRYNHQQLVIEGARLSDFHVSGVYSSTDPASLIRFLREQPGIKIMEDDNEVRIFAP
jgi:ferric-dicitrate binding protein FerR (iron transport regulator)